MSLYAVIGDPISHSKSPLIHSLFAEQTRQDVTYIAQRVLEENFDEFVRNFFLTGGSGLNITLPHKHRAYKLAQRCDSSSKTAKAANTLYQNNSGQLCAANTDGKGLVIDIKLNNDTEIRGKDLLLLGAGGAVSGALPSLINEHPSSITIVNRSITKANTLKKNLGSIVPIETYSYEDLKGDFDIIINGTSLSLSDELPPIRESNIRRGGLCYDMFYKNTETAFESWAASSQAGVVANGLGMLVEQAAESFLVWTGIRPSTLEVLHKVRKAG